MKPERISVRNGILEVSWMEGNTWSISLPYLRDECPCAGCKGETILLHTYRPASASPPGEEGYRIKAIIPVGSYAVQVVWKDGHDTGIYSWEYLETLARDQGEQKEQDYKPLL